MKTLRVDGLGKHVKTEHVYQDVNKKWRLYKWNGVGLGKDNLQQIIQQRHN